MHQESGSKGGGSWRRASDLTASREPGDAEGFPAGTGICHTFINNSAAMVRLLVVGETAKEENRIVYPRNPERRPLREDWWDDAPEREMGGHDGRPDALRARRAAGPA